MAEGSSEGPTTAPSKDQSLSTTPESFHVRGQGGWGLRAFNVTNGTHHDISGSAAHLRFHL